MKDKFKKWLIEKEHKSPGTANSYSGGIDRLSEHLTDVALKKYTDLYKIDDLEVLKKYSDWYGLRGNYSELGQNGNGTWRNALNAYIRFHEGIPRLSSRVTNQSTSSHQSTNHEVNDTLKDFLISGYNFENDIIVEANVMSNYYGLLYCIEVSIRRLVNASMTNAYGENWWNRKIDEDIRRNVNKKIKIEASGIYSEKSVHPIYFTTFRELRLIVERNWIIFSSKLKNIYDFKKITKDLNVIRNNVAHSVMLPEDEISRLKLALKDWFRLMK